MTAPHETASGRRGAGCAPWLIAVAVAGVILIAFVVGAYTLLGKAVRHAYDVMWAKSVVHDSALYLAAELDAGRPLPESEAAFIDGLLRFARDNPSTWLCHNEMGEGWVRYRPPPVGLPLQTDLCADDFLLWSELIGCEDLEWSVEPLINIVNDRPNAYRGTASPP